MGITHLLRGTFGKDLVGALKDFNGQGGGGGPKDISALPKYRDH